MTEHQNDQSLQDCMGNHQGDQVSPKSILPKANPARATEDLAQSGYRWCILTLAAASFTMAFVSRFAWPPIIPGAMSDMGISFTQAMAYMTAFYIGYVATQIPGGLLADRFGPRLVLAGAIFLQAIGTFLFGMMQSYEAGFALRILCGLGAGCVYASCFKAIVSWFSPRQRALAIGVVMTSPTLGIAIPNQIMPRLSKSFGWPWAFMGLGLCLLLLSILLIVFMREIKGLERAPQADKKGFLSGLSYVLRSRNIILISLAGFSIVWCQIGFGSVANAYFTERFGIDQVKAGQIMMLYGLIGILMPSLSGFLCVRFPNRKKAMVLVCHAFLALAFLLFGGCQGLGSAVVIASAIGLLIAFANPLYTVITADNASREWAGAAMGVGNCIFQLGAILSPLAIGLARDHSGGHSYTFVILAAGSLLGIAVTLFVGSGPKSAEETSEASG
jgi:predicted MFS family arabinose efflux permease